MNFRQTPNFDTRSVPNKGFVLHGTIGGYSGAIEWLCTPAEKRQDRSYSSAHYVIAKSGECTQLAKHDQRTWHAGNVVKPDEHAQKAIPSKLGVFTNPNDLFIGIELEWFGPNDSVTDAQINACAHIIINSGIENPIILNHKQICSYKSDFQTPNGDIDYTIVERVKNKLKGKNSREDIKKQILNLLNQL